MFIQLTIKWYYIYSFSLFSQKFSLLFSLKTSIRTILYSFLKFFHSYNFLKKIWHEEQFGPVIPIATFKEIDEIFNYLATSPYGQQASVFGKNADNIAKLVDILVNQVARVNLNTQCQRGPDSFPFTGRKDSAYGTLSVYDALRVFSIRALVATKEGADNQQILSDVLVQRKSNFLRMDYLF